MAMIAERLKRTKIKGAPDPSAAPKPKAAASKNTSKKQNKKKKTAENVNSPAPVRQVMEESITINLSGEVGTNLPSCFQLDFDDGPLGGGNAAFAIPASPLVPPSRIVANHAIRAVDDGARAMREKFASLQESKLDPAIFRNIENGSESERIEAMKEIWMRMGKEGADVVVPDTDRIVKLLSEQVAGSFQDEAGELNIRHRLCKYALNTLMEIFKVVEVAAGVKTETLEVLQKTLVQRMIDSRLRASDDGKSLLKGLNVLMLKILENADHTSSFHCLIEFLKTALSSEADNKKQFIDLVTKCIWKLTKRLAEIIEKLDLNILLSDMHLFFQACPPEFYKGKDDMPLKTVRTILSEIMKLKSIDDLEARVNELQIPKKSLLCIYIQKMGGSKRPSSVPSSVGSHGSKAAIGSTSDMYETQLEGIFGRLHKTETTQSALQELYQFSVAHPTISFQKHLADNSPVFKGYILRGLKRCEANAQMSKRVSSSGPIATTVASAPTGNGADEYRRRLEMLKSNATKLTKEMNEERPKSVTSYRARLAGLQADAGVNNDSGSRSMIQTNYRPTPSMVMAPSQPAPSTGSTDTSDRLAAVRARLAAMKGTE